jgi:hypothetical protein
VSVGILKNLDLHAHTVANGRGPYSLVKHCQ